MKTHLVDDTNLNNFNFLTASCLAGSTVGGYMYHSFNKVSFSPSIHTTHLTLHWSLTVFLLLSISTLSFADEPNYVEKAQIFGDPAVGSLQPLCGTTDGASNLGCGFGGNVGLTHTKGGDYLIATDEFAAIPSLEFFKRDERTKSWVQMQPSYQPTSPLCISDPNCFARFHAVSGEWAMIYNGDGLAIFRLNNEENPEWKLSQTLLRSDLPLPMPDTATIGQFLRLGLDGQNGTAVVGVPSTTVDGLANAGAVYVLKLNKEEGKWEVAQTLTDPKGVAANGQFGARAMAVSGDYAMVPIRAAATDTVTNVVLVYKRQNKNEPFSLVQTLKGDVLKPANELFGSRIAMSGKNALIGNGGNATTAQAYFYRLDKDKYVRTQDPVPVGALNNAASNLAMYDKTAVIGEPLANGFEGQISVFRFDDASKTWLRDQTIPSVADIPGNPLVLGYSVSISEKYIAGGAGALFFIPVPTNLPNIGRAFIYGK